MAYSDPNEFNGIGDPDQNPAVVATFGNIKTVNDPDANRKWNVQNVMLAKPVGPACIVDYGDPNQRILIKGSSLTAILRSSDAAIGPLTWYKGAAKSFELQLDTKKCPLISTTGLKIVPLG